MMLFNNIRPRGFHHPMIYADERKERLRAIEERARRELGMLPEVMPENECPQAGHLPGALSGRMRKPCCAGGRQRRTAMGNTGLVVALLALLMLLCCMV